MITINFKPDCFGCGSSESHVVLDLGLQAIIKFKDKAEDEDDLAPLVLSECDKCKLVQLSHVVPKDRLFRQYWYRSGVNQSMKNALFDVVEKSERWAKLSMDDWVIDIGSNDGTLLRFYRTCIKKVGFEPAKNINAPADIKVIEDYFNLRDAQMLIKLFGIKPKIITAIAMFYDLEDPNKFLKDVKNALHEEGLFVVQVNSLDAMIKNFTIDNISHEHLCYYSTSVLRNLLEDNGFVVTNIEHNSVNGGSVRMYCKHEGYPFPEQSDLVVVWPEFARQLEEKRKQIRDLIEREAVKHELQIWAYGASTRGYSLIQWLGVEKHLYKIADRNGEKWGKFLGKIPITSEAEMRLYHPPWVFVLPYSFQKEFVEREREYLSRGGKMIIPLPSLVIVSVGSTPTLSQQSQSNPETQNVD